MRRLSLILGVTAIVLSAQAVAAQTPSAYYVSPKGTDDGAGSKADPFATIAHAVAQMEKGAIHTAWLETGTYSLPATVKLTAADSGMTLAADPGQTPVIEGMVEGLSNLVILNKATGVTIEGLTFINTGTGGAALTLQQATANKILGNHFTNTGEAILLMNGASNNLISDNTMDNSATSAVEVKDGSNNNIFDSNWIDGVAATNTRGGGFFLHGVNGNKITHNLVENTAGMGIGISNWDNATINVGNVVEHNIIRNADLRSSDSGSIYMLGRSHADMHSIIADNLVDGTGSIHRHSVGIYLDDSTSGVDVTRNIVRHIGSDGMQIHGGDNNNIHNNILDLGPGRSTAALFQSAPANTNPTNTMLNDVFTQNIIYSTSLKPNLFAYIDGGQPKISNNLYFNTTGASMATRPPTQDTKPLLGDPKFVAAASGDYALQNGSAATSIDFQPIDETSMGPIPKANSDK